jgi:hypothetical protein
MFVDVISGNGFKPKEWHSQDINWTNFAHSLFWTGFSVPILGFVKAQFDIAWTGQHEGALFETVKFFCLNISNGLYLATHNYIRGFDKVTTRSNFFRSIIAWPFAVAFSPLGNALFLPSIVQTKFWSDFIAAIIEGSAKYKNIIRVKYQIMSKLIPDLVSEDEETEKLAMLDMIYFINESTRAKTALRKQLVPDQSIRNRLMTFIQRRENPVVMPNESLTELKKRMELPGMANELTTFIIERYHREQSLFLVEMVSENYYELKNWIEQIDK